MSCKGENSYSLTLYKKKLTLVDETDSKYINRLICISGSIKCKEEKGGWERVVGREKLGSVVRAGVCALRAE